MTLLVLSAADVHAVLGYAECAEAMRGALTALASGEAQQPLRTVVQPDGAAGLMALMPAYLVLLGTAPGRLADGEITVFESLGLAVEDLAAAALAYRKAAAARETGAAIGNLVAF